MRHATGARRYEKVIAGRAREWAGLRGVGFDAGVGSWRLDGPLTESLVPFELSSLAAAAPPAPPVAVSAAQAAAAPGAAAAAATAAAAAPVVPAVLVPGRDVYVRAHARMDFPHGAAPSGHPWASRD